MIDYSFWDAIEELTLYQAAQLWVDEEPSGDYQLNQKSLSGKFRAIHQMLFEAVENKNLGARDTRDLERVNGQLIGFGDVFVKRLHLKNWAENKGYKPKFLFPEMRKKDEPEREADGADQAIYDLSNAKPAYLDKNHPMFRRELSIAIEAWEQVLSSNPPRQKTGSRKKLIISWLEKHHKDLSGEAIKRISIMLNPDENGGAPSTD